MTWATSELRARIYVRHCLSCIAMHETRARHYTELGIVIDIAQSTDENISKHSRFFKSDHQRIRVQGGARIEAKNNHAGCITPTLLLIADLYTDNMPTLLIADLLHIDNRLCCYRTIKNSTGNKRGWEDRGSI